MKVILQFEEKDFDSLREFGKALERQCGKTYAGTDSFCVYFDYPKELSAMLRPVAGNTFDREKLLTQWDLLKSGGKLTFEVTSSKEENKL